MSSNASCAEWSSCETRWRSSAIGSSCYNTVSRTAARKSGSRKIACALSSNSSATYRFAKAVISVALLQDFNQTGLQGQDFGIVLTRSYTGSFSYAPRV